MPTDSPAGRTRVGVVGAGQIVEDLHLPVLRGRADVAVRWLADADSARADRLASMYGVPAVPVGAVDVALSDIDVCLIAIPLGVRGPYLDACRRRGVGVYVEKPFARTLADHDAVLDGFPAGRVAVGLQRRFYRSVQTLRAVAAGGLFGQVRAVRADLGSYSLKAGSGRYITDPKLAGGGVLIELGVHLLDQVCYILDADDPAVTAATGVSENGLDFHVEFESTLLVGGRRVPAAGAVSRLLNLSSGITVTFERAAVRVGIEPDAPLLVTQGGRPEVLRLSAERGEVGEASVDRAVAAAWDTFLTGLRAGTDTTIAAASARVTTRWVELIYEAMANA